jgi:hypothetical protein
VIRLYSFHAVPPGLLAYQRDMFARFMAEEHELVVVNDGKDAAGAVAISQVAATLGLRCEPIPLPERHNPSDGLAAAMDYAVAAVLTDDDEISVLLHADVLPGGAFSLRALIGDADVAAVPESKSSADAARTIHYPWSGFICLRTPRLPDRETLGFGAGTFDGIACDTGGAFRGYRCAHPALGLVALGSTGPLSAHEAADHLPHFDVPYPPGRGSARFAGVLLHYLGGAGWHPDDVRNERAKREWFTALCDGLLTGELTLLQTSAPAVTPWPADTP